MSVLEIQDIHKSFGDVTVLDGVDLTVEKGDVICVLGPSGSGKTTFLRCLNFLEKADSGTFTFDDTTYDFQTITPKQIASIRMHTGFVFQGYNLFANKTAIENVILGLVTVRKMDKTKAREIGMEMLRKVGLADRADYYPSQLSGGQQQRVAIARAIAADPEIIYFDEPTSALDPELITDVLDVMKQLAKEGRTMIVVTHEMQFAKDVSNHTIFMENGKIVEQGESKEFFLHPKNERTRSFLHKILEH